MSDRLHLDHILSRVERIERYTAEGRDAFLRDDKTQDAVLRSLQTLAESTQRLSEVRTAAYSGVDWRAVAGFRNVVVHNYLGLDLEQVWQIIEHDLPVLAATVSRMRADLDAET